MEYTITLSQAQDKALRHVVYDPQDWIENAIFTRIQIAIDEIVNLEVERVTKERGELTGTKTDIVLAANLTTAKQRYDEEQERILNSTSQSE